jgi:hypothetical protein
MDNIKIYFEEVRWKRLDRNDLAQGSDKYQALMNMIMNILVLYNVENLFSS